MTRKIFFCLLICQLVVAGCKVKDNHGLHLAAASDLKFAMDSLIAVFKKGHPNVNITVTYGSSGKFYEQILNQAPFDLYFSADLGYPEKLKEEGFALAEVKMYSIGRIVLWSKKIDPSQDGMNVLLDPSLIKIAIANPDHAPYGKRAMESLNYYKLYDQVKDKLVFGENISHAAQFVTTGVADIGIVALSLALSPPMQKMGGRYYLIPATSHQPLEQGFVVLKRAEKNALAIPFSDFMTSTAAREVMAYYGFSTLEE